MNNIKLVIDFYDYNQIVLECFGGEFDYQYAYYIYYNDQIVQKMPYSQATKCRWWADEDGEYKIKVFIKDKDENKISIFSDTLKYEKQNIICERAKKDSFYKIIKTTSKEIIDNRGMMYRIALFDYKLENRDSYLGRLWEILTPLIQIGTFWFVFGVGMRQGQDMNGEPYLLWLLAGLIPWFYINNGLTKGARAIFSKASTITKLRFPIATAPISSMINEGLRFLMSLVIMEVIFLCFRHVPNVYYLNLIYYSVYMFAFLSSMAMVTSVFTMIARDFSKLLNNLIRLLFYITPILWDMSSMPRVFQEVMEISPIYYTVRGFRDSLLFKTAFYEHGTDIIIQWGIVLFLYLWGCFLQYKFKNRFRDLI